MILVDTGPLVALFDPRDAEHASCKTILQTVRDPLVTTIPVLADASLVVAAEVLPAYRIFTLDRRDFATYRVRRGHRLASLQILS